MRTALLCPGPSLPVTYPGRGRFDAVVAVNRAATAYVADYWVALDAAAYRLFAPPAGNPKAVCYTHELNKIRKMPGGIGEWFSRAFFVGSEEVQNRTGVCPGARTWSTTFAITFCVFIGSKVIELYGHDMDGATDFTGDPTGRRDDRRWQRERKTYDEVVEWAAARGVKVIRHEHNRRASAGRIEGATA